MPFASTAGMRNLQIMSPVCNCAGECGAENVILWKAAVLAFRSQWSRICMRQKGMKADSWQVGNRKPATSESVLKPEMVTTLWFLLSATFACSLKSRGRIFVPGITQDLHLMAGLYPSRHSGYVLELSSTDHHHKCKPVSGNNDFV
jgi:hypothetical protein